MPQCTCASNSTLACGTCSDLKGSPLKLTNAFAGISSAADTDEETEMLAARGRVSHRIREGPKPHQRQAPAGKPKPLTKKQVDWIVSQVQAGKIHLPDLEDSDEPTYKMVWALVDSGSAAHVANVAKQFPGAQITESLAQKQGVQYVGATGDTTPNMGEAVITFQTADGQMKQAVFQNAAVGMPILSVTNLTNEGNDVLFSKHGGYILHLDSGKKTPFVKRLGVYFVQLKVPTEITNKDFVRQEP